MISLLIAIIYLAFISLGLPDSLIGAAWPVMRLELGADLSLAGIVTTIISAGTIFSSLASERITRRLGAGLTTAVSVALTATALFGFSTASAYWHLCVWAVPYGLGAGAVDAALNNYVALHFAARHMNWLHCFWGVGASVSPYIMQYCLASEHLGWQDGYLTVSLLQAVLTVCIFLSLPLWKRSGSAGTSETAAAPVGLKKALAIPGVPLVLLSFFGYCAMEATSMYWACSYLVEYHGMEADRAAGLGSLVYLGLTAGRFLCGFIADRVGDKRLIRIGSVVIFAGLLLIALPAGSWTAAVAGMAILGIGCAPIYPSIIHSTPANFGAENSQAIVGIQMASAYTGSTLIPPIFGFLAQYVDMGLYPWYLALFAALMFWMSERLNRMMKTKEN
ncbi:MAG: MFS transporter [Clostridia bacterium]|nr:MFS transporter [Clostridia bacterium]